MACELLEARQYPGVVALVSDALDDTPECVPLLLIRARAHTALRRDLDAQADLRDIIRLDPSCIAAFRLLGELATRRNENAAAAVFFREALRLDPDDLEAADWLLVVGSSIRPAAVAPARHPVSEPRFAKGTQSDDLNERPTRPFARGSAGAGPAWQAPAPRALVSAASTQLEPSKVPSAKPAPRVYPRPVSRSSMPELPGFGDYLVSSGILTRERLRAAQAYQRSMKVQLATAIVTLGLATPQRIEWAAVSHQSERARGR